MNIDNLDKATLEYIVAALEQRHGNRVYRAAWRSFAASIRTLLAKKLEQNLEQILVAQPEKISSTSHPAGV